MSAVDASIAATRAVPPTQSKTRRWFRRYSLPALGALVIVAWIIIAAAAPSLSPYFPATVDVTARLRPPSWDHWLGTDVLGRDVFTRLIYAGRVDLLVAFFAVFCPFCIGTALGALAGYYGRFVDTIVMRLVDIVVAFPFIVLVLALVFVLGPGERSIIIAITSVGWVSYARIVRGEISVVLYSRPASAAP